MKLYQALVASAMIIVIALPALAQSTLFTYQGELKRNGQPANGAFDLRFRLYDAASAGQQLGSIQCFNDVAVTNGRFTASLDFNQQFASINARYLEIEIRQNTTEDCGSSSAGYTVLSPRQLIAVTPRAAAANVANALSAPDGTPANAVVVDNAGKLGVGTATPTHTAHIAAAEPTLALQDTDSTAQQAGYVSYRDSGNIERGWVGYGTAGSPVFSIVNARPAGHIALLPFNGGNVGVGTTAPAAALDVRGDIRFGSSGQLEAVAGEERLRTIRGTVNWNGAIIRGRGFASTRINEGDYLITFTTPFSDVPTVTVTVDDLADSISLFHYYVAGVFATTTNSVRIRVRGHSSSTFPTGRIDQPFHFIVVGPR